MIRWVLPKTFDWSKEDIESELYWDETFIGIIPEIDNGLTYDSPVGMGIDSNGDLFLLDNMANIFEFDIDSFLYADDHVGRLPGDFSDNWNDIAIENAAWPGETFQDVLWGIEPDGTLHDFSHPDNEKDSSKGRSGPCGPC
jgi:hypothetical protein